MNKKEIEPRNGFATGNYYNNCTICRELFLGDKRAYQCSDCAYKPNELEIKYGKTLYNIL